MTDNARQDGWADPDTDFEEVREALEALFVSGDPEEAFASVSPAEVNAFLREDDGARKYFDRLAVIDRALGGGLEALPTMGEQDALPTNGREQDALSTSGDFERSFGEAAFTAALDDMLAEERAEDDDGDDGADVVSLFGSHRARSIAVAVAAMAALGLGIVLMNDGPTGGPNDGASTPGNGGDDGFRARSAVSTDRSQLRAPELELFCVRRSDDGVSFEGTRDEALGTLRCPIDAELKLAFENRERKLTHAAFFGVDTSGKLYWYGPTPATRGAKPVEAGPEIQPFGETIRLEVNHRPGRTRIHAVFATAPIDFDTLEGQLETRRPGELFDSESLELRGFQTASTSRVIDIADASDGSEQ